MAKEKEQDIHEEIEQKDIARESALKEEAPTETKKTVKKTSTAKKPATTKKTAAKKTTDTEPAKPAAKKTAGTTAKKPKPAEEKASVDAPVKEPKSAATKKTTNTKPAAVKKTVTKADTAAKETKPATAKKPAATTTKKTAGTAAKSVDTAEKESKETAKKPADATPKEPKPTTAKKTTGTTAKKTTAKKPAATTTKKTTAKKTTKSKAKPVLGEEEREMLESLAKIAEKKKETETAAPKPKSIDWNTVDQIPSVQTTQQQEPVNKTEFIAQQAKEAMRLAEERRKMADTQAQIAHLSEKRKTSSVELFAQDVQAELPAKKEQQSQPQRQTKSVPPLKQQRKNTYVAPQQSKPAKKGGINLFFVLIAIILIFVIAIGGLFSPSNSPASSASSIASSSVASVSTLQPEEVTEGPRDKNLWSLVLVNIDHPLPDGYKPEVVSVGYNARGVEQFVDARIADTLKTMIEDAKKDGVQLQARSAYRSHDEQTVLFNSMLQENMNAGNSYEEAYAMTRRWRNVPGTSEHETGLAVDIVQTGYIDDLNETLESTDASIWLKEHAADYGFILRYMKGKTDITGTSFEPWHYRYVGIEDAQKIMQLGVSLEEYLDKETDIAASHTMQERE